MISIRDQAAARRDVSCPLKEDGTVNTSSKWRKGPSSGIPGGNDRKGRKASGKRLRRRSENPRRSAGEFRKRRMRGKYCTNIVGNEGQQEGKQRPSKNAGENIFGRVVLTACRQDGRGENSATLQKKTLWYCNVRRHRLPLLGRLKKVGRKAENQEIRRSLTWVE